MCLIRYKHPRATTSRVDAAWLLLRAYDINAAYRGAGITASIRRPSSPLNSRVRPAGVEDRDGVTRERHQA